MRANHPLSSIGHQVMWNRLISVVEEEAQTLVRTAFGMPTREAGDLSADVYDIQGRGIIGRQPGPCACPESVR
jgi:N-methylhydantoinase B